MDDLDSSTPLTEDLADSLTDRPTRRLTDLSHIE